MIVDEPVISSSAYSGNPAIADGRPGIAVVDRIAGADAASLKLRIALFDKARPNVSALVESAAAVRQFRVRQ